MALRYDGAKFTKEEREAIEPRLQRIMSKMTPNVLVASQAFADPIALVIALYFWSRRVIPEVQALREKEANDYRSRQQNTAYAQTYSTNGVAPSIGVGQQPDFTL